MPQAFGRGRRRAGRALLLAAVLLAHAVLLGGALSLKAWGDRQPPRREAPPLQVVLLQPPAPVAPRNPPVAPRLPARRAPQAITIAPPAQAAAPAAAVAAPAASAPPAVAEAPSSAPPRLDLRLPRRMPGTASARNPALDDPRANTPQATMEERLSAAMGGDGRWVMERLDGDRIRYRRGNDCVEAHRTRAGQLELANGAFRNLWAAKPC